MKDITINLFKQEVEMSLSPESRKQIDSFYVFGSLARGETIQSGSDIDSVLVLNQKDKIDYEAYQILSDDLMKLDKSVGIEIDHVICTQDDLFELLSPTLIMNLHADGVTILGNDLKQRFAEYVEACPKSQMLNSFLRTDMFRRHQLRKKYAKLSLLQPELIDDKAIIGICKEVILEARDLLYFEQGVLITPKKDICSYFLANVKDSDSFVNLPMYSYNIRFGVTKFQNNNEKLSFLGRAFDFMEISSVRIQNRYKELTGNTKLDLRPF